MQTSILYHLSMLGAVLDLVLFVSVVRRRGAVGIGVFRLLLLAVATWLIGEANGRIAASAAERAFWLDVQYFGRPLTSGLWLLFALRYTRVWRRVSLQRYVAIFAVPVVTVILAWTNGFHGLMWSPSAGAPGAMLASTAGLWFRSIYLPYAWVAVAGGCLAILWRGRVAGGPAMHRWLFLAVGVPPLAVSVAGALSERVRAWPELVPLAFVIGAVPLLYGLARNPVFGLSLSSYRTIFESIGDAVLVIDNGGRVTDLNRAAERAFRRPRRLTLGLPAQRVLPQWRQLEDKLEVRPELHEEIQLETDGRTRTLEVHVFTLGEISTRARYLVLLRDISSRHAYQQQIEHLAYHDPLTGLPNRRWLEAMGDQLLDGAARERREAAVLFIDLDDFKDVNDTLGHAAGDDLLLEVAQRFRTTIRAENVLMRLGGDEFAVLVKECDAAGARAAGSRLLETLAKPFHPAGAEVYVGASIGVALFPRHGVAIEDLLRRADVAMYTAKRSGGSLELYDPETDPYTHERLRLQSELHRALQEEDQLLVYYQPIVDSESRAVIAVEALVRWQHPERGFLEPASFLPVAEGAWLIRQLDRYVLARALQDWREATIDVAVNVHPRSLVEHEYAETVAASLEETGFPARRLILEITEKALTDSDGMREVLEELAGLGVVLMADDYGTGQSSLMHIRRFPFHGLKIDRSMAAGIGLRREDEAIVEAVAGLAKQLGLRLVVEGVETAATIDWLSTRGCHILQGFALGRPQRVEDLLGRHPELHGPRRLAAVG